MMRVASLWNGTSNVKAAANGVQKEANAAAKDDCLPQNDVSAAQPLCVPAGHGDPDCQDGVKPQCPQQNHEDSSVPSNSQHHDDPKRINKSNNKSNRVRFRHSNDDDGDDGNPACVEVISCDCCIVLDKEEAKKDLWYPLSELSRFRKVALLSALIYAQQQQQQQQGTADANASTMAGIAVDSSGLERYNTDRSQMKGLARKCVIRAQQHYNQSKNEQTEASLSMSKEDFLCKVSLECSSWAHEAALAQGIRDYVQAYRCHKEASDGSTGCSLDVSANTANATTNNTSNKHNTSIHRNEPPQQSAAAVLQEATDLVHGQTGDHSDTPTHVTAPLFKTAHIHKTPQHLTRPSLPSISELHPTTSDSPPLLTTSFQAMYAPSHNNLTQHKSSTRNDFQDNRNATMEEGNRNKRALDFHPESRLACLLGFDRKRQKVS